MLDSSLLDDVVNRLSDVLPADLCDIKNDLEKQFRSILQSTLTKLDLVTREEFERQANVLAQTRAKLDAIEKQIASLEEKK